jgi:transposase-like protein
VTPTDVALAFGVSVDRVQAWITKAQLHVSGGQGITDADVLSFLRVHRTAFDLRTVDQVWFLDLLFSAVGHGSRRAITALQRAALLADLRQTHRVSASARRLGINRTTIYVWARQDPIFRQQLAEHRAARPCAARAPVDETPSPDRPVTVSRAPRRSLSLDHGAQYYGVSRRTIYNRIREGTLQTIRVHGSQRVVL